MNYSGYDLDGYPINDSVLWEVFGNTNVVDRLDQLEDLLRTVNKYRRGRLVTDRKKMFEKAKELER
jgi:hypothetical protein